MDADDIFNSDNESRILATIIEPRYSAMLRTMHTLVGETFPTQENFRLDDASTREILAVAAQEVVRITDATKAAIQEQLTLGQMRGYSQWQIAYGVPKDGYRGLHGLFTETWRNRELTVARNELLEAQHRSAMNRYRATGLVSHVKLRDGTGRAPDAPCLSRNGDVKPITDNIDRLHINCSLVVIPILREGISQSVEWKPTMTAAEADAWAANSAVKHTMYHFTTPSGEAGIKATGFNTGEGIYGTGIYLTESAGGEGIARANTGPRLSVRMSVLASEVFEASGGFSQVNHQIALLIDKHPEMPDLESMFNNDPLDVLRALGYKAQKMNLNNGQTWWIAFDKSIVTVVE